MPRLQDGDNERIDNINKLVFNAKNGIDVDECMSELLEMFKPMLLSVCDKWAKYFNDTRHCIKSWDDIMSDAKYWFMYYTMYKYEINGDATYNKFIKDHIDQRIRYIYECELKYYKRNIFPDPKDNSDAEVFESVAFEYSSNISTSKSMESSYIDKSITDARKELAHKIIELVESGYFSDREKLVFVEIMCNGTTQKDMGDKLDISRTRITQILNKVKSKLYQQMDGNQDIWDLICKADVDFEEK